MLYRIVPSMLIVVIALAVAGVARSCSNASWYGPGLYGNTLGCGGHLTTSTWGVAHKTLPCGARVTVCYARCVAATVIDRGPFVPGREFDLTYPVKRAIGMGSTGCIRWWRR